MTLEARHAILDTLTAVLGDEYALAVMDHRKAKKCPLTPLSAKILAKQFGLCPDPKAAVEEMLNRGWTGFKAEWLVARSQQRTGKRNFADVAMEKFNGTESVFGSRRDVELVSTGHGQSGSDDGNLRGSLGGYVITSRH